MFEIRQIFVLLNFCPCRCSWTHEKHTDERHALKLTIADVNLVERHRFTKGDVHPYNELELTSRPGGRCSQSLVVEGPWRNSGGRLALQTVYAWRRTGMSPASPHTQIIYPWERTSTLLASHIYVASCPMSH